MVVDYQKVNEIAIDKFLLPEQEDILQSLVRSQWYVVMSFEYERESTS
jgi:hypothetical protein